jgi:3-deoxy-7-phosphoheptulonate synthase
MKTPSEILEILPADEGLISKARATISKIIHGLDPRLLVILGPCSIHSESGALHFADKVLKLQKEHVDRAFFVMRAYFEKPRTEGGWKGFLNDPDLDGSYNIEEGLTRARRLLIDLAKKGLPVAMEFLDPNYAAYLEDLVSWGCIGARTCSSQVHRNLASNLKCPIGFKNSIHGKLEPAVFSIKQALAPQTFFAPDTHFKPSVIQSLGNQNAHLVLRGSDERPNYDATSVNAAAQLLKEHGIYSQILIDCGHGNSQKDPKAQLQVMAEVMHLKYEKRLPICGLMIESHLEAGAQEVKNGAQEGLSITDPCLDIATVEKALESCFSFV